MALVHEFEASFFKFYINFFFFTKNFFQNSQLVDILISGQEQILYVWIRCSDLLRWGLI